MTNNAKRTVRIVNDLGLHLRAAGSLAQLAGHFAAEIWLENAAVRANAKSIMSVLSLTAAKGTELTIIAEGDDAEAAVAAIADLIEHHFDQP